MKPLIYQFLILSLFPNFSNHHWKDHKLCQCLRAFKCWIEELGNSQRTRNRQIDSFKVCSTWKRRRYYKALEQLGFQKFHSFMYYAMQLCNFLKQSMKFVPNTHWIYRFQKYCSSSQPSKAYHHISLVKYSSTFLPSQYYVYPSPSSPIK